MCTHWVRKRHVAGECALALASEDKDIKIIPLSGKAALLTTC